MVEVVLAPAIARCCSEMNGNTRETYRDMRTPPLCCGNVLVQALNAQYLEHAPISLHRKLIGHRVLFLEFRGRSTAQMKPRRGSI
ncbi:hypothetical protein ACI7BZ_04720 [Xanthobacter sp. AM11]|uniref:hypothetical protein n=1 Tax=Xanthobacter sp. AM11 TaxID=3380643 RepID=UPI0039BF8263